MTRKTKTISHDNKINCLGGAKTGICNDSQQESVAQKYWIGFEFLLMGSCMWASQDVCLETD